MSTREHDAALLAALADELETLARIRIGVVRERMHETLELSRGLLLQSLAVACATVVAVVFLVRGIAGGVSQWLPGREWIGELGTGVVLLGALIVAHRVRVWASRRRRLRTLQRDLAPRSPRGSG